MKGKSPRLRSSDSVTNSPSREVEQPIVTSHSNPIPSSPTSSFSSSSTVTPLFHPFSLSPVPASRLEGSRSSPSMFKSISSGENTESDGEDHIAVVEELEEEEVEEAMRLLDRLALGYESCRSPEYQSQVETEAKLLMDFAETLSISEEPEKVSVLEALSVGGNAIAEGRVELAVPLNDMGVFGDSMFAARRTGALVTPRTILEIVKVPYIIVFKSVFFLDL